jgi:DNA polymerase-3 subunit delta
MASKISPAAFRAHVASGELAPVYALYGNDGVLRSELVGLVAGTLEEDVKAFNFDRFFVPRRQLWAILDAARSFPMMASRRVVVVMNTERLLASLTKDDHGNEYPELVAWGKYLHDPVAQTTLVLSLGSADERMLGAKALLSQAAVVDCSPLGDKSAKAWDRRARAERWLQASAQRAGAQIEKQAVSLFAEYFNADIGRLRTEFERLLVYAAEARVISEQMAVEVIGRRALADTWALNNALGARDPARALRELRLKLDEGEVPFMILGQIRAATTRFEDPARLAMAPELLLRTDLALKASGGEPRVLLERLVVELCR